MELSPEDASLLFRRWRDEQAPIQVKFFSPALMFDATGVVSQTTANQLHVSGPSWQLAIPLDGAGFSFSDPREVPNATIRNAESARYEFGVSVDFTDGNRLTLLECKPASEPADE